MNKSSYRYAMRNVEYSLRTLRKATNALGLVDSKHPINVADNLLMDWLDSAIVYRDNPDNWRVEEDESNT
jgi:hypothetical protein